MADDIGLRIDRPATAVIRLTLDRPPSRNALTRELVIALNAALDDASKDPSCRAMILTGANGSFCSGQVMRDAAERNQRGSIGVVERLHWQEQFAGMIQRIRRMPQPVIAAVDGAAVGAGMGLALAADVRLATSTTRFLVASIKIGLSAGESGISYHLPRLIGAGRAGLVMLSGRPIEAAEAERIGLVSLVVEPQHLEASALEIAAEICANSPFAVAQTKRMMWQTLDAASLDAALELENRTQILAVATDDYREATRAFVEKRPPRFEGR